MLLQSLPAEVLTLACRGLDPVSLARFEAASTPTNLGSAPLAEVSLAAGERTSLLSGDAAARAYTRARECRARETAARARREDRSIPSTLYLYRNDSTVTVFAYYS